jgi:putative DNA primase/helicase
MADPPDDDEIFGPPKDDNSGFAESAREWRANNVTRLPTARARPPRAPGPARQSLTEQDVMRRFVDAHANDLRFNHDTGLWLIWHNQRWREDRKQKVLAMILELCRSLSDTATVQKLRFARAVEDGAKTQVEFATVNENWDNDPMTLGTLGGTVDLVGGIVRPGLPEDMISKVTACGPAEHADCPRWLSFLDGALEGKQENIQFLQRACGYSLTGLTSEEALFYIAGKSGSGKGTATTTIKAILRDYAATVPMTMFTDTGWRALEYYRAKLPGKRLILASEPEKGATWSDAFVNEITGSDHLSGRQPRGRVFDFVPTHKLWINGEQVPELKSVASGLRRRLRIIPFNHPPAIPDSTLKTALRAEFGAILRWMIEGCLDWQEHGLNPPPDVIAASDEYFANQDTLSRWIEERCDLGATLSEKPGVLLVSFNDWAGKYGEKRLNTNAFHEATKHRFETKTVHGTRWMRGLTLKTIW